MPDPFLLEAPIDDRGFYETLRLESGYWLCLQPLLFQRCQLAKTFCTGATIDAALAEGFSDVWEYNSLRAARGALYLWALRGGVGEPDGWTRNPLTRRRRHVPRFESTVRDDDEADQVVPTVPPIVHPARPGFMLLEGDVDDAQLEEWLRTMSAEQLALYREGLEDEQRRARQNPRRALSLEYCARRLEAIQRVLGQRGL